MKTTSIIIGFLAMSMGIVSCAKDIPTNDSMLADSNEVRILLGGDIVNISSNSLTKGSSGSSYYAFEVDSISIVEYHDYIMGLDHTFRDTIYYIDTTYCFYAEALYENPTESNLRITLENGHKYRIRCSVVIDAEESLYVNNDRIQEPFASSAYGYGDKCIINNSFSYGETKTVYAYNPMNVVRVNDGKVGGTNKWHAMVNRYYGETITDGMSNISINLTRRNFGLHFNIVPPQKGALKVYEGDGLPAFEYNLNSQSSTINDEHIYSLDLTNNSAEVFLKVIWTDENGEVFDLSPKKFRAYNKTMTNITVDINSRIGGGTSNSRIGLVLDNEAMESGSIYVL